MEFPDLIQEKDRLVKVFSCEHSIPAQYIRVIASPYRICPLGAHIDHQGGPVLGMTINAYSLLAYVPDNDGQVTLRSDNYPGQVEFDLDAIPEDTATAWGAYPRAAALALSDELQLKRGIHGLIKGMLPGCGLSSSASVLLAYLIALAQTNGWQPRPWELVRLTRQAENKYIGLNNGILDQTSIVFGKSNHLLYIDTLAESVEVIEDRLPKNIYRLLIAYSGFSRELMTSSYNTRVQECCDAAAELSRLDGRPPAQKLADIPAQTFRQHGKRLPHHLQRRAAHFFSEVDRVSRGLNAWQEGRLKEFGRLMVDSCRSSIEQYECGIPAIHDLQQIVCSTDGVIGSRFGGGGFGGCVVSLVTTEHAIRAIEEIQEAYLTHHPEAAKRADFFLARSVDGVHFL